MVCNTLFYSMPAAVYREDKATPAPRNSSPVRSLFQVNSGSVDKRNSLLFLYRAILNIHEVDIKAHLAGLLLEQRRSIPRRHIVELHIPYLANWHIDEFAEYLFPTV